MTETQNKHPLGLTPEEDALVYTTVDVPFIRQEGQNSILTEIEGGAEWADHAAHLQEMVRYPNTHFHYSTGRDAVAWALARITELEAHIAAEPERMRGVVAALNAIELYASNHGGWFEHDAWLWGQSMGAKAKEALAAIRAQETGQ